MSDKKEKLHLWRVTHSHHHGDSHYLVYASEDLSMGALQKWAETELVEDFEPHRGEDVAVEQVREVYAAMAVRYSAPTPAEDLPGMFPEDEEGGTDICDACGRSDIQAERTTDDGKVLCSECSDAYP